MTKHEYLEKYGKIGKALLYHLCNLKEAIKIMENGAHFGAYDSELNFAIETFKCYYSHCKLDEINDYINYRKFCDDIFMSDYFSLFIDNEYHIFLNNR